MCGGVCPEVCVRRSVSGGVCPEVCVQRSVSGGVCAEVCVQPVVQLSLLSFTFLTSRRSSECSLETCDQTGTRVLHRAGIYLSVPSELSK